jgi:FAD/FMN-containing dehydrogenase
VVLLPTSTDQVQAVLKYCNDHRIAVVPQSGNTSASGGNVKLANSQVWDMALTIGSWVGRVGTGV